MTSLPLRNAEPDARYPRAVPARNEPIAAPTAAPGTTYVASAADDIALVVRQRRVHFDSEREYVDAASGRIATGWNLRLFALHDKGAHGVADCPCCRHIALELRRVVETVLRGDRLDASLEIGPLAPVLYDSSVVPGRDEVALAVRLWPCGAASRDRGGDEACARRVRERLKRYGISES